MNIIDLKPCPFCGGIGMLKRREDLEIELEEARQYGDGGTVFPMVLCRNQDCGCCAGPLLRRAQWQGRSIAELEQLAVDAWNRRTEEVQA